MAGCVAARLRSHLGTCRAALRPPPPAPRAADRERPRCRGAAVRRARAARQERTGAALREDGLHHHVTAVPWSRGHERREIRRRRGLESVGRTIVLLRSRAEVSQPPPALSYPRASCDQLHRAAYSEAAADLRGRRRGGDDRRPVTATTEGAPAVWKRSGRVGERTRVVWRGARGRSTFASSAPREIGSGARVCRHVRLAATPPSRDDNDESDANRRGPGAAPPASRRSEGARPTKYCPPAAAAAPKKRRPP